MESINHVRGYTTYRREGTNNIESQKARATREWTELGIQLQRAFEGLKVRDEEISELEQVLAARRAF